MFSSFPVINALPTCIYGRNLQKKYRRGKKARHWDAAAAAAAAAAASFARRDSRVTRLAPRRTRGRPSSEEVARMG